MVRAGNGLSVAGSALAPQGTRVVAGLAHLRVHPHLGPQAASFPRRTLGLRSRPSHPPHRCLPRRSRHLDQPACGSSQPAGGCRPNARGHRSARRPRGFPAYPYLSGTRDRRFWTIPEPVDSPKLALERPSELPESPPPVGESKPGEPVTLGPRALGGVSRAGRPALCGTGPRRVHRSWGCGPCGPDRVAGSSR